MGEREFEKDAREREWQKEFMCNRSPSHEREDVGEREFEEDAREREW